MRELIERLEKAEALQAAAVELAKRTLEFVAPPPRARANPMLDADLEMERLSRAVLAVAQAPLENYGDVLSASDIALLAQLRAKPLCFVKIKATGEPPPVAPINPDGPAAAALIERLARQLAALRTTEQHSPVQQMKED